MSKKVIAVALLTKGAAITAILEVGKTLTTTYGAMRAAVRDAKRAGYESWVDLKETLVQRKVSDQVLDSVRKAWFALNPKRTGRGGGSNKRGKMSGEKVAKMLVSKYGKDKALTLLTAAVEYLESLPVRKSKKSKKSAK